MFDFFDISDVKNDFVVNYLVFGCDGFGEVVGVNDEVVDYVGFDFVRFCLFCV